MKIERFAFASRDARTTLAAYRLEPESPCGMLQISHGMCEYFLRYEGFARYLAQQGWIVFGHDHLGHGNSAPDAADLGFTASGGGADFLIEDLHELSLLMKQRHPTLPLILFGHSMGSFIARAAVERYGADYRAAVYCGTGGPETPAGAGRALASLMMCFCGERHRSRLLRSIAFAGYNKKYPKPCDKNAWLTRDTAVVDRYREDPFCAYTFTLRAYHDLFGLVQRVSRRDWAARCPCDLPILLTAGEMDPVGAWGAGVREVDRRLRAAGVRDVTLMLYPEMRHEILNELGRERVWKDILQWIESKRK